MGFGYIIHKEGDEYVEYGHIGTQATVYQGEVFAVDRAVTRLLALPGAENVDIYIDNQATILSLTKPECKSKTAYTCRLELIELGSTRQVKLHWVRAHVGHELNEMADKLAKSGKIKQAISG